LHQVDKLMGIQKIIVSVFVNIMLKPCQNYVRTHKSYPTTQLKLHESCSGIRALDSVKNQFTMDPFNNTMLVFSPMFPTTFFSCGIVHSLFEVQMGLCKGKY